MNQSAMHNTRGCNAKVDVCADWFATSWLVQQRHQASVGAHESCVNRTSK